MELISKVAFPKKSHLGTAHSLGARVHSQTQMVTGNTQGPLSGPSESMGPAGLQTPCCSALTSRGGWHQPLPLPGIFLPRDSSSGSNSGFQGELC